MSAIGRARSVTGCVYAMAYALAAAAPEVLSFRDFRAGLAGVLDRVRRSPDAAVFVGAGAVNAAFELPPDEGLRYEALPEQGLFADGEAAEGIRAFVA